MTKILIVICVFLAIGLGFAIFSRLSDGQTVQLSKEITADLTKMVNPDKQALEIVIDFCKLVEQNDRESLESLVTKMPEAYWKVYTEAGRRNMGNSFVESKKLSNSDVQVITPNLMKFANNDEIVTYVFGTSGKVNEVLEKFDKVLEFKQNGNEAKATVRFKFKESIEIDYEILLYQENERWKVFEFGYPDSYSEKWAVVRNQ